MAKKNSQEATDLRNAKAAIAQPPAVDLSGLPDINQIHFKIAIGLDKDTQNPPADQTPDPIKTKKAEPARSGLRRWEKISLAVLFSMITGFSAGAGLAFLILDGKLDINKQELKALMDAIRHHGDN